MVSNNYYLMISLNLQDRNDTINTGDSLFPGSGKGTRDKEITELASKGSNVKGNRTGENKGFVKDHDYGIIVNKEKGGSTVTWCGGTRR